MLRDNCATRWDTHLDPETVATQAQPVGSNGTLNCEWCHVAVKSVFGLLQHKYDGKCTHRRP